MKKVLTASALCLASLFSASASANPYSDADYIVNIDEALFDWESGWQNLQTQSDATETAAKITQQATSQTQPESKQQG
jgi:hypothetical protein